MSRPTIAAHKKALRDLADVGDGVLARDVDSNRFEIIDDDELEAALANATGSEPLRRRLRPL